MKTLIIATLAATISFASVAGQIELPRVSAPSELTAGEFAEGTVTQLSASEVAEFLPWAQNSRNQLNRALTQAQSLPLRERLPHIERAVRAVVARSGNRQYQMMMRFSLNRGLLLVDELERNVNMNEIGSQESALDILQRSINVGLAFYESDLAFQQRAQSDRSSVVTPHAQFGAAFMQGMYAGVVNVLDATAQYRMLYKLIEMVNWDLSRDAEANRYAEIIVEAYEMGQDLPEQPSQDDKANLRMIRRLNSLRIIALRSLGAQQIQNNNDADGLPEVSSAPDTYVGSEVDSSLSGKAYDSYSGVVRTVRARAANGTIIFTDGVSRGSSNVQELVRSKNGISMGDNAYDSYSGVVRSVKYITSGGIYIFTDNVTRGSSNVQKLVSRYGKAQVGGKAYDAYSGVVRTVAYISAGGIHIFTDNITRGSSNVQGLVSTSSSGISVGDQALDTYSGVIRRVSYITENNIYIFSDGVTRGSSNVSRLQ